MAQSNTARRESNQDHQASDGSGKKPVDKFQDGPVHVSIWENGGVNGAFRTASFQLRYKDQKNEWQTGHSYGAADLKHLENASKEARARVGSWQQGNKAKTGPKASS